MEVYSVMLRAESWSSAPAPNRVKRKDTGTLDRAARGAQTRERIVQVAAQAFSERGYLGVNLDDVVRQLGLTRGALYYFFPTKPDIAREIVGRHFAAWEPLVAELLEAHDDVLDMIIDATRRVGRMYQADCIARAGTRLSTERMLIDAELPEPFVGWVTLLTALIDKGQIEHQIRADVSAPALAQLIVSYFYGAQTLSDQFTGRADLIDRLDQFWAMTEPYLRPANQGLPRAEHPAGRAAFQPGRATDISP